MTHLYAFADKENIIQGFFWADVNPISNSLGIHVMSVNKVYWGTGVLPAIVDFAKILIKTLKLDEVTWVTTRPKAFERIGMKYSKQVMMKL